MTLVHGSYSVWQLVIGGVILFACQLATMDLSPLEKMLGEAVLLALQTARITSEEAAALMKMHPSQLQKCLRGDQSHHFSLNRLLRLPWSFWLVFSPALLYLVAKKHAGEVAETFGLRKSA